jgi:ribosomal protein L10
MNEYKNLIKKKKLSLKKRKGIYQGEFISNFLKKNKFFIICHTNDMQLETYLPIRNEFDHLDFKLKFLKRNTILNFFDKFQNIDNSSQKNLKQVLNGSIAIIYPKKTNKVHIKIFDAILGNPDFFLTEMARTKLKKNYVPSTIKQQNIVMLGFFLKNFYLISKGQHIFKKYSKSLDFNPLTETNLFKITNTAKVSSLFLTIASLFKKFYDVGQPWNNIFISQLIFAKKIK